MNQVNDLRIWPRKYIPNKENDGVYEGQRNVLVEEYNKDLEEGPVQEYNKDLEEGPVQEYNKDLEEGPVQDLENEFVKAREANFDITPLSLQPKE